jgi:hypothetical protein
MKDTPQHIQDLQLKIWLSKPPMERLRQAILDNEAFFEWVKEGRKGLGATFNSANPLGGTNNQAQPTTPNP